MCLSHKVHCFSLWSRFVVYFELAVAQCKVRTQPSFAHTSTQRSGCPIVPAPSVENTNFSPSLPVMGWMSFMGLCVWTFSRQLVALFREAVELLGYGNPWLDEAGHWGHAFKVMAQPCFQSWFLLCDLPGSEELMSHTPTNTTKFILAAMVHCIL